MLTHLWLKLLGESTLSGIITILKNAKRSNFLSNCGGWGFEISQPSTAYELFRLATDRKLMTDSIVQ